MSRSRAMVAIDAPRGVRVIRHELLEGRPLEPPKPTSPSVPQLSAQVEQQVEEATRRLQDAMELLKVGSAEEAYDSIAVALSELDVLSKTAPQKDAVESSGSHTWSVAETVAESTASYCVSEPASELSLTVRYAEGESSEPDEFLIERLRGLGYQVAYA
ncbi:MAG: hypothetical protein AAFX06_16865 [Planctomycetota bacterium]